MMEIIEAMIIKQDGREYWGLYVDKFKIYSWQLVDGMYEVRSPAEDGVELLVEGGFVDEAEARKWVLKKLGAKVMAEPSGQARPFGGAFLSN